MKVCIIIPARYQSTRFPGKPLALLLGKPMILWVAELCAKAIGKGHVYVATDNQRIANTVENAGFKALITSSSSLTGTDRIAEASQLIDYDIYINVQGDEPLVNPQDILRCINIKKNYPDFVINGFCWIGDNENPESVNIPKVIMSEKDIMIYMSRNLLPGFKSAKNRPKKYAKQVCIYAFNKNQLNEFTNLGKKSILEESEDIEILRFLELDTKVLMFECSSGSLAVDIPEDISMVESSLLQQQTK